jgi:hypothetical protein
MSFRIGEVVRSGNATARVKNYYLDTDLLVLMDIRGTISSGTTVVGDDSGATKTFTSFIINDDYDLNYEFEGWQEIEEFVVTLDDGEYVAIDEHFTGNDSDDYQTTNIVVL